MAASEDNKSNTVTDMEKWAAEIKATKEPYQTWISFLQGDYNKTTLWTQADSWSLNTQNIQRVCLQTWTYPEKKPCAKTELRAFPPYSGGRLIRLIDEKTALPHGTNPCTTDFPVNWKPDADGKIRALWVLMDPPRQQRAEGWGLCIH